MKVAQRFSAGSGITQLNQSPRSGRQNFCCSGRFQNLCRPFHGLTILSRSDPSAEALGYFHTVRYRGRQSIVCLQITSMVKDPTIQVRQVWSEVAVSDFNNPAWDSAEAIQIDRYWSGEPAPAHRQAEARILWTKTALSIRYVCNQAEPLVVIDKPQNEEKSMGLWDRDVCEMFIAPDPHIVEKYFEFESAPTGEWLDAAIDLTSGTRETDWEFHSHMAAAAKIEKDRVTTAMRIPWSLEIPQPQQGEHWRINLFRCVGRDPNRGYLSWQPTRTPEPLFHVPKVFGWLVFE